MCDVLGWLAAATASIRAGQLSRSRPELCGALCGNFPLQQKAACLAPGPFQTDDVPVVLGIMGLVPG